MAVPTKIPKPQAVSTAVNFLWTSMAISLVKMWMYFLEPVAAGQDNFTNSVLVFAFVLIGVLIFNISLGRNWARLTFLVLLVSGMVPALPVIMGEFAGSLVAGILSLVQCGCQIYALFLLFSQPGAVWFRKVKTG